MYLSKAVSILCFLGALAIGIASAFFADSREEVIAVEPPPTMIFKAAPVNDAPVSAEDLVGRWRGTWGYDRATSTIDIDRVDGDKFYGTLKKLGAEIAIEGRVDTEGRNVFFRETKVINLGPEFAGWSLGKNSGSFS